MRIGYSEYTRAMGRSKSAYVIFIGKYEGSRLIGRPRFNWEDIIKINLKGKERENVDYILLIHCWAQLCVHVNVTINLQVP
jgi:hypothetical protein